MFIGRRPDTSIYGLWAVRQWAGQEELPADHADVVAFQAREVVPSDLTLEQKLGALGITLDGLKEALGIQ